jgi:hypothetical protein
VTLGFNSTLPSDSEPQYPLSRAAHSNLRAKVLLAEGAKRKTSRSHYLHFQSITNRYFSIMFIFTCLRTAVWLCVLFSHPCKKRPGGGVLTFLPTAPSAMGHQRGPAGGVMIGNHRFPDVSAGRIEVDRTGSEE